MFMPDVFCHFNNFWCNIYNSLYFLKSARMKWFDDGIDSDFVSSLNPPLDTKMTFWHQWYWKCGTIFIYEASFARKLKKHLKHRDWKKRSSAAIKHLHKDHLKVDCVLVWAWLGVIAHRNYHLLGNVTKRWHFLPWRPLESFQTSRIMPLVKNSKCLCFKPACGQMDGTKCICLFKFHSVNWVRLQVYL